MVNSTYYHNDAKKVIKRPLTGTIIWTFNWLVWVTNMLIDGYSKKYKTICDEKDVTPFFKIAGYFLVGLCVVNLAYLIFILVFNKVRKNNFLNISNNTEDTQLVCTQKARNLYYKTSNIMTTVDSLYRVTVLLLYVIIIGFTSKIIYIFENETCDTNGWSYFTPAAVIALTGLMFIGDCIAMSYNVWSWKNRVTDLEMPTLDTVVTPVTSINNVDVPMNQLESSTVSSSVSDP